MSTNINHIKGLRPSLAQGDVSQCWSNLGVTPREWQMEALPIVTEAIREQWQGDERFPLCQAVMGAGKSLLLAAVVQACLRTCSTIVVTTPRAMLVRQLARTLSDLLPTGHVGVYYGKTKQPHRQVIVACDASTSRLAKTLKNANRQVELWIADECHGSEADRIKGWVEATAPYARLGLTATPRRAKASDALSLWNDVVYRYHAGDALRDGVVVPFVVVPWQGDDIPLDDAMAEMIEKVVSEGVGPGVVDAASIEEAVEFAWVLNEEYNVKSTAIHSDMPPRAVKAALRALEEGDVDCIVHVAILKEGINLPWLRWIGLRRQVSSPVHFAQHVGRVLRAHPGKEHALILDPGDLFSRHSLTLEAILECDASGDKDNDEESFPELQITNLPPNAEKQEKRTVWVVPLSEAQSWLRNTTTILRAHQCISPPAPGTLWRKNEVSMPQLGAIERWGNAPRLHDAISNLSNEDANSLRSLYKNRNQISRGDASDLISVLACFVENPNTASIFAEIPSHR